MTCNADRLIESLIAVQMMEYQRQRETEQKQQSLTRPNVVTVSRECGSMGKKVAQLLANVLELRCCDRFILQEVARRAQVDEELVEMLDQHVSKLNGHWWQSLIHRQEALTYESYYQNLVKTILSISRAGGVILGRGANLILGQNNAFRIRITGSLNKCANNIARRDNISQQQAMARAMHANNERAEYIRRLYDVDINDMSNYDMVLNSDRFSSQQMVELVISAMQKAGYTMPAALQKNLAALNNLNDRDQH